MTGLGLKEEKEIGVLLEFAIVGIMALCRIDVFKGSFDFALLAVHKTGRERDKERGDGLRQQPCGSG